MCCSSFWTALQILWSFVYILCGTTQLVSGIFFLISLPALHYTTNVVAGCLNILVGLAGGAIVCFSQLSPKRQEVLLYLAVALLWVNLGNVVVTEWGLFFEEAIARTTRNKQPAGDAANQHVLVVYACCSCRIAAAVAVLVSFLDTQFAFCSMQLHSNEKCKKREEKPQIMKFPHENSQDIEYIIPRQSTPKSHTFYNAYAQSWVFEADHHNGSNNNGYSSKIINGSPLKRAVQNKTFNQSNCNGSLSRTTEISHLIDNPVVHIEEASDESSSNRSDRNLCNMRSFSRTNSPLTLSASSSQISLNRGEKAPIYNYLEKLTEPEIYRSRLNSALSSGEPTPAVLMHRIETPSPRSENAHYSSLMQELQKAIVNKKDISPQSTSDSITSNSQGASSNRRESNNNSDVEFSKELEAALQLIQDLESPNTVETPSEGSKTLMDDGILSTKRENSRQELSTFKPENKNGPNSIQIRLPDSQSTSGYSSPTHNTPVWSTTSSINGITNHKNKELSYSIRNANSATVISLYTPNVNSLNKEKNITLISINGDNTQLNNNVINTEEEPCSKDCKNVTYKNGSKPISTTSGWKSLLRKKRASVPKLCPELEGAIVKSESLAYLSELELLARHQRNHEIHREIEERVIQQLGVPRTDSRC